MNVIVRRAFALLLLAGAVGASLALPAIFDGSQLASRGPLPTGTNPASTQVRVSLPVVKPHRTFNAPSPSAVTRRPVAQHVAPVVRPRAHPAPAPPVAAVTPVSPPATPAPNPAPAPAPATTSAATAAAPALAAVSSEQLTPSAPAPTVPALTDPASTQTREKHGNKIQTEGGNQSDNHGNDGHTRDGNGNGHGDNGHGKNGNGNGNGKGH